MNRNFLVYAAVLGAAGVALGAFGAHGLQQVTTDDKILHGYQTAVQYQLYHALALLAVGIIHEKFPNKAVKWAGNFFVLGIFFFSGSLYLLTFLKLQASGATSFVGPVTPLGGILLIAGWVCLLTGVLKKNGNAVSNK